jgi:hypothetical protein
LFGTQNSVSDPNPDDLASEDPGCGKPTATVFILQKDGITGEFRRNAPECGRFADTLSESLKQNRLSELKIPVKRFA